MPSETAAARRPDIRALTSLRFFGMATGLAFLRFPTGSRNWPIALGGGLLLLGIGLQRWIPFPMMREGAFAPAFALLIFGFCNAARVEPLPCRQATDSAWRSELQPVSDPWIVHW